MKKGHVALFIFSFIFIINVLGYEGYDPARILDDYAEERALAVEEAEGYLKVVFLAMTLVTFTSVAILFVRAIGALLWTIRAICGDAQLRGLGHREMLFNEAEEALLRTGQYGRRDYFSAKYRSVVRQVNPWWVFLKNALYVLITLIALAVTVSFSVHYLGIELELF